MRLRSWSGKALRTGNDGGVARVVLGDALLDLADEVRADVGGLRRQRAQSIYACVWQRRRSNAINWQCAHLGEDAAADACKHADG